MTFRRAAFSIGAVSISVLPLIACGSDRSGAITAPSANPITATSSAPFGQANVSGAAITAQDTSSAITVTSLVSGTACPTLQFMIYTYVIKTDASTTYSGGSCSSIHAGTKLMFTGTRPNNNEMVFNASQITISTETTPTPTPTPKPEPTPSAPTPVQAEVTITGASGTCPDVTFMVGTYTFKTSSSTYYSGATCADLKIGAKVTVVGTKREGDGFIVVTGVGIKRSESTPPSTPAPPTSTVSGEGTVTALVGSTSCPSLTFMISTYSITVTTSTQFEGGTCGSINVGTKVEVTGSRTGDTTVAASKIVFRGQATPAPTDPSRPAQVVEGEGVIGSLSSGTACPALQFLIGSYVIKLDGATQYVGGFCGDLKAGQKVGVKGTLNADGSVAASRVSVLSETPRPEPEAEGEGFVTGLVAGTACPALQFRISEYTITVNESTQFTGGSCSSIASGMKVGVKGRMTGEKTATASQITVKN